MNTFKWLIRREFWEHKGLFLWVPVVIAGLLGTFVTLASFHVTSAHGDFSINGHQVTPDIDRLPPDTRAEIVNAFASGYTAIAVPLLFLLALSLLFYCLGALYDERRDRSILFWKSLPVSDAMTVGAKAATALLVVPLLYVAIASMLAIFALFVTLGLLAAHGVHIAGDVLAARTTYTAPLVLVGLLPVYALWALPSVGWFMMVSSWARSKVFLWAVGAPLMFNVVIRSVTRFYQLDWNVDWFIENIVLRTLTGVVPGAWDEFEKIGPYSMSVQLASRPLPDAMFIPSWQLLMHPPIWIGALAGVAMLAIAVRLRRLRSEA